MAQNESFAFFLDALNSRMAAVKSALRNAVQSLLNHSQQERTRSLQALQRELELLRDFLAPAQRPGWLSTAITQVSRAIPHANSDNEQSFYQISSELCPVIMSHEWNFGPSTGDQGFDFDPIYDQHRKDCRIPELFDSLIEAVEALLNDPAMDSRKAEKELQRLIATLKKAKRGSSFIQTVLSLNFATAWLKHSYTEYSEKGPLGPAVKAFRKALVETQTAMEEVSTRVQTDVNKALQADVQALPVPTWPRITMRDEIEGSE